MALITTALGARAPHEQQENTISNRISLQHGVEKSKCELISNTAQRGAIVKLFLRKRFFFSALSFLVTNLQTSIKRFAIAFDTYFPFLASDCNCFFPSNLIPSLFQKL